MSRFTNALVVSPMADGKTWVLLRPFGYDVGEEGSGDAVDVDIGFMTDFASIPRIFWILLPRWGKYGNATVVHDWLYWAQVKTRRVSDNIMLEAMGVLSVPSWKKYLIYWMVRIFGGIAWKRNQWDRIAKFDRVLKKEEFKSIDKPGRYTLFKCAWKHYRAGAPTP